MSHTKINDEKRVTKECGAADFGRRLRVIPRADAEWPNHVSDGSIEAAAPGPWS